MSRRVLPVCLLLGAVLAAACHRGGRDLDQVEPESEADSNEPVRVLIRSFHAQPVRIHIVRGANSTRLGVVAEARGQTFEIPRDFYGSGVAMYFVFTLVGGTDRLVSDVLTLRAGNYIEWTIAEQLKYSTVFVW